jgi:hypothetical protein
MIAARTAAVVHESVPRIVGTIEKEEIQMLSKSSEEMSQDWSS